MDQNDLEALLATLRQAQDGSAPAPDPPAAVAPPTASHQRAPSQGELDSLLSTLTALPSGPAHAQPVQHAPPPPTRAKDHSALSFHEALPILNSLAMDPHFLEAVEGVWDEQKTWELRMKDERNRLEQELGRSGAKCVSIRLLPPVKGCARLTFHSVQPRRALAEASRVGPRRRAQVASAADQSAGAAPVGTLPYLSSAACPQ